jgi:hypothetical protein
MLKRRISFFNRRDLKVLSEDLVRHVPWCISYHAQSFGLEAFKNLDVRDRSRSPELYAVGPDSLVRVIPRCFRLAKMCLCHVSRLSRCKPRYLTSSAWGSCSLYMCTGGHVALLVVKVTESESESESRFDQHSVGQCVLVSSPFLGF